MNIPVSVDMQGLAIVYLIHAKNGLNLIQVQAVIVNITPRTQRKTQRVLFLYPKSQNQGGKCKMKKKIAYILITLALILSAFLIGKNMPDKYDYLNLNQVTETKKYGNNITIYTSTGDCYDFTISK